MSEPKDPFQDVTLSVASVEAMHTVLTAEVIPSLLSMAGEVQDVLVLEAKVHGWVDGQVRELHLVFPRSSREHIAAMFANAHFLDEECRHPEGHH